MARAGKRLAHWGRLHPHAFNDYDNRRSVKPKHKTSPAGVSIMEPALRLKAEACRRLADINESAERKLFWPDRADYRAANLHSKNEARRLAVNFTKLPDLLLGGAKM